MSKISTLAQAKVLASTVIDAVKVDYADSPMQGLPDAIAATIARDACDRLLLGMLDAGILSTKVG